MVQTSPTRSPYFEFKGSSRIYTKGLTDTMLNKGRCN